MFYLNPSMDYERAYGAELHNLIRVSLYGYKYCYKPMDDPDRKNYDECVALWKSQYG